MDYIKREITNRILRKLIPNKVIVIVGARRVGKTILVREILEKQDEPYLYFNGEDINSHDLFAVRSVENFKQLIGDYNLLYIDEAQKIPDIGQKLKLIVDEIEGVKIIITGSSAFDIGENIGEPLTGRKFTFNLHSLSENEFKQIDSPVSKKDRLKERLIFGNYPELLNYKNRFDKIDYLNEILSSYLLKDILAFEKLKNSHKIFNLLRMIAYQLGGEVSMQELGNKLNISKNTVERYLDLLRKVFILHRVEAYSNNKRKEIFKTTRWYFLDNGIRNAVISNFNALETRNDIGQLWENYMIAERLKSQHYKGMRVNNYFWRTYSKQEIDWVEEREGNLFGYEFKWSKDKQKQPPQWGKLYPNAEFKVIANTNYLTWLK
jgi:predicted AAA+ superfamily ATPase